MITKPSLLPSCRHHVLRTLQSVPVPQALPDPGSRSAEGLDQFRPVRFRDLAGAAHDADGCNWIRIGAHYRNRQTSHAYDILLIVHRVTAFPGQGEFWPAAAGSTRWCVRSNGGRASIWCADGARPSRSQRAHALYNRLPGEADLYAPLFDRAMWLRPGVEVRGYAPLNWLP